jgi:hypothetical protein
MKVSDLIGSRREVFSIREDLLVLSEKLGFAGMLPVSDLLNLIGSDEKARADLLEAFMFPPR